MSNIVEKLTGHVRKPNPVSFRFENGLPVGEGHHGGLRLRLLTSSQLGIAQLLFPITMIVIGYAAIEYGIDAIIDYPQIGFPIIGGVIVSSIIGMGILMFGPKSKITRKYI